MWHALLASFPNGMLTLAFTAVVLRLIVGFRDRPILRKTAALTEPVAYLAAVGGLLVLVGAALSGLFGTWPQAALFGSPLVLNKVLVASLSIVCWALFVAIRSRWGEGLWQSRRLTAAYLGTALGGFSALVVKGCLTRNLIGEPSLLDPLFRLLRIEIEVAWLLPPWGAYLLLSVGPLAVGTALWARLRQRQRG
jgi:hypothetical protein